MEILVPYKLAPVEFTIEKLWDYETEEEIDSISPGVKGQKVLIRLPIECKKDWIIRRKKIRTWLDIAIKDCSPSTKEPYCLRQ